MGLSVLVCLALALNSISALPANGGRIVGGSETTIALYPYSAALLYSSDFLNYLYSGGGVIINNRSVLTVAHLLYGDGPARWRVRVGSVHANFGGHIHNSNSIIVNPSFNFRTLDNDIAIIRSASVFTFSTSVAAASLAGATFPLPDFSVAWAIGWGATVYQGQHSATLRHVQVWVVNQFVCSTRYADIGETVTDNMICTGVLDVGGRDQCTGDEGCPVVHNNVVIGLRSFGLRCGLGRYPGVSTRVSRYSAWITANM